MKATELAKAFNEIDDAYLAELEPSEKERITMKNRKKFSRILIAAAVICLLSITAFAAERARVNSLVIKDKAYNENYEVLKQEMEKSGLDVNLPEQFTTGFRFQEVRTGEVEGTDDAGNLVMSFRELTAYYRNDNGQQVSLRMQPNLAEEGDTRTPTASKTVGGVTLNYYVDHYKFVPDGYEPSEEEQQWMQQPGNYLSYGSDEVVESAFAFLNWKTAENDFSIADMTAAINPDVLFAMAEEIIK